MRVIETDILIVGGGSGGFGAAIRAARVEPRAHIILIDSMAQLGGTSTVGGVNNWEPGIAGPGVHYELYARLPTNAIGVGKTIHYYSREEPYGLSHIDPASSYESSLRRSGLSRADVRRVHFEPDVMAQAMHEMLTEAGVDIRSRTRFSGVNVQDRRLVSVTVHPLDEAQPYEIRSKLFVDCSGGCHLALAAECEMAFGEEPHHLYEEPSAPETASPIVNGISQIFRVTPVAESGVDELLEAAKAPEILAWLSTQTPATAITDYPNGDLCMNVLPTMEGAEFHSMPYPKAQAIAQARMYAHWRRMQTDYGFDRYRFKSMFPLVGIRESHRLVGRYVLREQDVRAGLLHQPFREAIIGVADHPLDTHGERKVKGPKLNELAQPYGIPYACLLPKEYDNLITASRGSSFSHIAASSCRLSRTMMALGEAAGIASALALRGNGEYADVGVDHVREHLGIPAFVQKTIAQYGLSA